MASQDQHETNLCPCKSGKSYESCCGPILSGRKPAKTAEDLMRSRYTAYCRGRSEYVLRTWHKSTRPVTLDPGTIPEWNNLEVIRTEKGHEEDSEGYVEFRASAMTHLTPYSLHETSYFVKEKGQWFYVSGKLEEQPGDSVGRKRSKTGRNSPCPCGSGKKFKKCCGR